MKSEVSWLTYKLAYLWKGIQLLPEHLPGQKWVWHGCDLSGGRVLPEVLPGHLDGHFCPGTWIFPGHMHGCGFAQAYG